MKELRVCVNNKESAIHGRLGTVTHFSDNGSGEYGVLLDGDSEAVLVWMHELVFLQTQAQPQSTYGMEPIHGWFGLSYSSYLVIPRSILQSLPVDLQRRFVDCLQEMDGLVEGLPVAESYWIRATKGNKFVADEFSDYERGRRKVQLKK